MTDSDNETQSSAFSLIDLEDNDEDEGSYLDECVLIDIESFITLDSDTDIIHRPLLSFQALSIETS